MEPKPARLEKAPALKVKSKSLQIQDSKDQAVAGTSKHSDLECDKTSTELSIKRCATCGQVGYLLNVKV